MSADETIDLLHARGRLRFRAARTGREFDIVYRSAHGLRGYGVRPGRRVVNGYATLDRVRLVNWIESLELIEPKGTP